MRIPKSWVALIAKRIAGNLTSKELLRPSISLDDFISHIEAILIEELSVEDRLNEEVREILKQHETHIERGRMDYRKLFDLTKQKLVKERNLVL